MSNTNYDSSRHDDGEDELRSPADTAPITTATPLRERVLGAWARACNALQYLAPMLLAPLGGLIGLAYFDQRGALIGAFVGMLLAVLLMPLIRRAMYLGGALPLAFAAQLRRRPVLTLLMLVAAGLMALELRSWV